MIVPSSGFPLFRLFRPYASWMVTIYLVIGFIGTATLVWASILTPNHLTVVRSYYFYVGCFVWLMALILGGFLCLTVALEAIVVIETTALDSAKPHTETEAILQRRIGELESMLTRFDQHE